MKPETLETTTRLPDHTCKCINIIIIIYHYHTPTGQGHYPEWWSEWWLLKLISKCVWCSIYSIVSGQVLIVLSGIHIKDGLVVVEADRPQPVWVEPFHDTVCFIIIWTNASATDSKLAAPGLHIVYKLINLAVLWSWCNKIVGCCSGGACFEIIWWTRKW